MIYIINLNYISTLHIIFFIIVLCAILLCLKFKQIKKIHTNSIIYEISSVICIFIAVVFGIINTFSLVERISIIEHYKNAQYSVIEGEVQNLSYTYAKNTNIPIGISFVVDNKFFEINKGILNYGYSVNDGIITNSGQHFKIYYIEEQVSDIVNTIVRIDSCQGDGSPDTKEG